MSQVKSFLRDLDDAILRGSPESRMRALRHTTDLLIAGRLLGFENSIGGTFEIFIQLGAILAVVGFFARDLLAQARAIPTDARTQRFWIAIASRLALSHASRSAGSIAARSSFSETFSTPARYDIAISSPFRARS